MTETETKQTYRFGSKASCHIVIVRGAEPIYAPGTATIIGRTYGSPAQRRTIRVVVARTDLTGKLELTWAADAGHAVGDAHCTQNFKLTASSPASIRPTMLMCWRTSPTLSAYSITIDFDHKPKDSDGVAALEEAWNSAA